MSSHFQASCLVLGIFLLSTTCSSRDLNPLELGLFKAMVDKCLGDKTYFIAGFCQDVFQRADELGLLSEGKVTSESPLPVHSEGETNATGEPSPSNHARMYDMSKRNTSEVRRDRKHVRTDVGVADTSHFDGRTHQGQLTGHQVNTENDPEVKKVTESSHDNRHFRKETMPVKFARSNQGKRSIKQLTEAAMSHEESVDSREFNEAHLQLAYDFVELLRVALQRESENEFSRAKENIGYALSATFDIEAPDVLQQETEGLITFMVKLLEEDSDGDDEKAATDVAEHLKRRMSDISQCSSKGVDASLIDITTTPMSPHDNYEETLAVEEADIPPTETSAEGKDSTGHWEKNQMERKDRRPRRDIERWIPKSRYDVDDSRLSGERYKATYLSSEAAEKAVGNVDQEIEECFARYIVAEELFKSENFNSEEKSHGLKSEGNLKNEDKSESLKSEAKSQNLKREEKSRDLKSEESLKSEEKSENLESEEKSHDLKSEENLKSEEKNEKLKSEEKRENLKSEEKSENLESEEKSHDLKSEENLKSEDRSKNFETEENNENLKSEAKSDHFKSEENNNENLKSEDKSAGRRLTQRAVLSYVDEDIRTSIHQIGTAAPDGGDNDQETPVLPYSKSELTGGKKGSSWYIILVAFASFCVALVIPVVCAKLFKY